MRLLIKVAANNNEIDYDVIVPVAAALGVGVQVPGVVVMVHVSFAVVVSEVRMLTVIGMVVVVNDPITTANA